MPTDLCPWADPDREGWLKDISDDAPMTGW